MPTNEPRNLPTLLNPRWKWFLLALAVNSLLFLLVEIRPPKNTAEAPEGGSSPAPCPDLTSSAALESLFALDPKAMPPDEAKEVLRASLDRFRGAFSPLPGFDDLDATFRIRSLAAARGTNGEFIIALSSEWDGETLTEKLKPFRDQLARIAPHKVDIERKNGGAIVETHFGKGERGFYLLRHSSWMVLTNAPAMIDFLVAGMSEQTTPDEPKTEASTWERIVAIIDSLVPAAKSLESEDDSTDLSESP